MTWLWIALACTGPSDTTPPTGSTGTVDTGTRFVGTGDLDAECVRRGKHPLMFDCTVRLDAPGAVELVAWLEDDPARTRTFRSQGPATEHELLLWGLKPDRRYLWRAGATTATSTEHRTGRVKTERLPTSFAATYEVLTHTSAATVDGLLTYVTCTPGKPHIIDEQGDVVWYVDLKESLDPKDTFAISAVQPTEDGTLLVLLGRDRLVEVAVDGEVRMVLVRDEDFEHSLHHDVVRHGELTYVPFARAHQDKEDTFVVDGIYAFDGAGKLAGAVSLHDLWPLMAEKWTLNGYWSTRFPDAFDPMHANSLSVDASGNLVVSFRHLHAVAGLQGDPTSPDFGSLMWSMVGDPSSHAGSGDFKVVADKSVATDFSGQHDAHFIDGERKLLMLDNRLIAGGRSRAVRMDLDGETGVARVEEVYDLGEPCPIQGSARSMASGSVVVACSTAARISELAAGAVDPLWDARARCGAGLPVAIVPRAIPVDLTSPTVARNFGW